MPVRVVGGSAKGRRIKAPPGEAVRPTLDRVRESLFNILAARVVGARVLDLFAGSGALGIEALSRGAAHAVFADSSPRAVRAVGENLAALGLTGRAEVLRSDAAAFLVKLAGSSDRFDLVFMDPPYGEGQLPRCLPLAAGVLAEGGLVVAEHDVSAPPPGSAGPLVCFRTARYGSVALSLYQSKETPDG